MMSLGVALTQSPGTKKCLVNDKAAIEGQISTDETQ